MISLVRPVNIIMGSLFIFWDVKDYNSLKKRVKEIFNYRNIIIGILVFVIIWLPQMLYWKYLFNSFVSYSYKEEGFTQILGPKIIELFFAAYNSLFLFNPIFFIIIIGLIFMVARKAENAILIAAIFIIHTYITASWHVWDYGMGYGARPFVDFYPLFVIPFSFLNEYIYKLRLKIVKVLYLLIILFLLFINQKIVNLYPPIFYPDKWDYSEYLRLLYGNRHKIIVDFEDEETRTNNNCIELKNGSKSNYVLNIDSNSEFYPIALLNQKDYALVPYKKIRIEFWAYILKEDCDAMLVVQLNNNLQNLYWNGIDVKKSKYKA